MRKFATNELARIFEETDAGEGTDDVLAQVLHADKAPEHPPNKKAWLGGIFRSVPAS